MPTGPGDVERRWGRQKSRFSANVRLSVGHFTFWISLSLSEISEHTHRPQGVNYHGYLHVLKFLLLYLNKK